MDWREWAEDTGGKQLKKKNNFIVFKIVYITLFSEILSKLKLCIDLFQGLYNFFFTSFFHTDVPFGVWLLIINILPVVLLVLSNWDGMVLFSEK